MSVEIIGEKRLKRAYAAYPLAFTKAMEKPMNQAAAIQSAVAKALAPVNSGELREGIETVPATSAAHHVVSAMKSTAEHGPFVEYGTSTMDAQPFMRPARDNTKKQVFRHLRSESSRLVGATARRVR